ncbi:DUF2867 domain-containing protein [Nonomuraea sp. NPDC050202]|jgi:hypothetical protein|uniref:DUF2867 domain-containing protein n=1 Tax=Nonomuraea sp. NPDC050202 TaxID=3155035 RepID=UPI0033C19A02
MRLSNTAHTTRPWRIHALTPDFRVEDVWALPTPGGPGDLPRLVRQMSSGEGGFSGAARALFALRWKLGRLFGWDGPRTGVGARVHSLRERLPADLRDGERGPDLRAVPLTSVFLTGDEWVAETANRTVHTLMHIGWVPDGSGGFSAQMAVLVKPNGLFGTAYMAAIRPFRHLIVDPALVRLIGRGWRERSGEPSAA